MTYGEVAGFAKQPATAPVLSAKDLKQPSQFRLIGKDVDRYELPAMVDGTTAYAIDVELPGMVYATVLRPPVEGKLPDRIDAAAARQIPGVTAVIPTPWGVGVAGTDMWAVFRGIEALRVTWKKPVNADGYSSAKQLITSYRASARRAK